MGVHGHRLEVDVGLEEAVEQHQAVGAGVAPDAAHVGQRELKYGPTLTASGIESDCLTRGHEVERAILDARSPVVVEIGGDEVDVQLQGVGPGVLHQLGVADPAARRDAVEAGDDGIESGLLGRGDRARGRLSGPVW